MDLDGFAIVSDCLDNEDVLQLAQAIRLCADADNASAVRRRHDVFAVRNLVDVVPEVLTVFSRPRIRALLRQVLGTRPFLTKAILFDKTAAANWHVSWHQDLSIAVTRRAELAGWTGWSLKVGVPHVQPPPAVLQEMVTLRLHLDPCRADQGALKVIPGSHRRGRLSQAEVDQFVTGRTPVTCEVEIGGAVLLKPLLLHASSAAQLVAHRRVLHFELSRASLPSLLEWIYGRVELGD